MKALILRSSRKPGAEKAGVYCQRFDVMYADRVLGNLRDTRGFCAVCEADCINCRGGYRRNLSSRIAGVLDFPAVLPHVLENPAGYIPGRVPAHDVMIAVHVHEQILLEMLKRHAEWGLKGVVVPLEAPNWISGATRRTAFEICEREGIEIEFPKPFCSFNPPKGGILREFQQEFHIGRPDVAFSLENGIITRARVNVSAACGATYYIARWLEGRSVSENLRHNVISRRFHCYPCTASMEIDDELQDTPLHAADQAHQRILDSITGERENAPRPIIRTTLGSVLPPPVASFDIEANIAKAEDAIMAALSLSPRVSIQEISKMPGVSPASARSAALLLKKKGEIKVDRTHVFLA